MTLRTALPVALFATVVASAAGAQPSQLLARKQAVSKATVTVVAANKACTGFVAHEPTLVVTAAHCVPDGATQVTVRAPRDARRTVYIEHVDRDADLAVLRLPEPLEVRPLVLADDLPAAGEKLLFVGRPAQRSKAQVIEVDRLGVCPSLPDLPQAVFTDLNAIPGDSGAPLVDEQGRVVALVHGGARCHIATPTAPLSQWFSTPRPDPAPAEELDPPRVEPEPDAGKKSRSVDHGRTVRTYRAGPFTFEETENGFRLHWSFRFGFGEEKKPRAGN